MSQERIVYERNPNFVFRQIADEVVLVPIRQEVADMDYIYTMNPIGAFIWEQLADGASVVDLAASIQAEFDADPKTIALDLQEFLTDLESIEAIRKA